MSPAAAPALPSPPSGTATPFSEKSFSSRRESREASGPSESLVAARAAYHAQKERSAPRPRVLERLAKKSSRSPKHVNLEHCDALKVVFASYGCFIQAEMMYSDNTSEFDREISDEFVFRTTKVTKAMFCF